MLISKRVSNLEKNLENLIERLKGTELRVRQFTCDHSNVEFVDGSAYNSFWEESRYKMCNDCGKVLKLYLSKKDYLEDKLAYLKERSKEEQEDIKYQLKLNKEDKSGN